LLLSATPYKGGEVVQNLRLKEWSGDVIYKITEKSLRKRKVLSDYKVFELVVDHNDIDYDIDSEDYSELREKLIFNSDFRNGVLIKTIGIMQKLGVKTLVLFQSIDHGSIVSQLTDLPFISGRDKNKIREQRKKEFLEADGGVLLASNIFKKGITLPAAEVLINVDDGVQDANTIQKKGRVLGVTETKERSAIIDFIDLYDAYFSEHSDSRLDVYVDAIGEDNIGILDTSSDDWAETLERWIKKWLKV
jgi:superfamily II DNA or RNA helicase